MRFTVSNPSGDKGRRGENQVVHLLRVVGFTNAERRRLRGINDACDVSGVPLTLVEVKWQKVLRIPQWLRETRTKFVRDLTTGLPVTSYCLAIKVDHQWYAVVPFVDWASARHQELCPDGVIADEDIQGEIGQ